ncbi:PIN domain-containing protein [Undibacterium arcticum]
MSPLDTRIALSAADLSTRYKLAMADAVVYASALAAGGELLTSDAHFCRIAQRPILAKEGLLVMIIRFARRRFDWYRSPTYSIEQRALVQRQKKRKCSYSVFLVSHEH